MSKNCNKCGKELLPGDNFCVNCGLKIENAENEHSIGATSIKIPKKEDGKAKTNWFAYFLIIATAILFLKLVTSKMETSTPLVPSPASIPIISQEDFSCITNPDYLAAPETFTVDKENKIPATTPHVNTLPSSPTSTEEYEWRKYYSSQKPESVWVEDILDENTIKVSYTETLNGQKFLNFAAISLYGLGDISDECQKKETIAFLKSILKDKFVYLSETMPLIGKDYEKIECREKSEKFKQFTEEYPIMSKRLLVMDVRMIEKDLKSKPNGLYLAYKESSSSTFPFWNDIDVSKSIIASGYGTMAPVAPIEYDDISSFCFSSEKITYFASALSDDYFNLEIRTAKEVFTAVLHVVLYSNKITKPYANPQIHH